MNIHIYVPRLVKQRFNLIKKQRFNKGSFCCLNMLPVELSVDQLLAGLYIFLRTLKLYSIYIVLFLPYSSRIVY